MLILAIEWWARQRQLGSEITWTIAVAVGLAQLLAAVFPGTSRAGRHHLIALALGLNRPAATEFSFLLGIPTLFAASGYEIYRALKHPGIGAPTDWGMVALGLSGRASWRPSSWSGGCCAGCRRTPSSAFGWYRIALGVLMLALGDNLR